MKNLILLGFVALFACKKHDVKPLSPIPPAVINDTINMYVYSCKFDSLFTLYPYDQVIIEAFNGATMTDSVLLPMGTEDSNCRTAPIDTISNKKLITAEDSGYIRIPIVVSGVDSLKFIVQSNLINIGTTPAATFYVKHIGTGQFTFTRTYENPSFQANAGNGLMAGVHISGVINPYVCTVYLP